MTFHSALTERRFRALDERLAPGRACTRCAAAASPRRATPRGATGSGRLPRAPPSSRRRSGRPRRRRAGTPSASAPSPSGTPTTRPRGARPRAGARPARASSCGGRRRSGTRYRSAIFSSRRSVRSVASRASSAAATSDGCAGRAEVVREDRMLAMLALLREALVATVQAARPVQAPVPAARLLEQVARERAHVAQLRARRKATRLPQRSRHLRIALELRERRARTDAVLVDPARHDAANVDERVRLDQPARSSGTTSVPPWIGRPPSSVGARRLPELQPSPSSAARPRAARAAFPRA